MHKICPRPRWGACSAHQTLAVFKGPTFKGREEGRERKGERERPGPKYFGLKLPLRCAPTDGSSTRGGSTSVRGRVRSPHMANMQAASVPIAEAGQLRA